MGRLPKRKKSISTSKIKAISIRTKLTACIVIVVLLVSVAVSAVSLYSFTNYMNDVNITHVKSGMEGLNSYIEDSKGKARGYSAFFAENQTVSKAVAEKDEYTLVKELESMLKITDIDFVTVTDSKGNVILRTDDKGKKGDNAVSQSGIMAAINGRYLTAVEFDADGKMMIKSGSPVLDSQGKVVGAISAGYDLSKDSFVDYIKEKYDVDVTLFLGDVIVSTTIIQDGKRIVGTKLDQNISGIVLRKGQKYQGNADIFKVPYAASYMPIIGANNIPVGVAFVGRSMAQLDQVRDRITWTILAIALIAVVIVILFGYLWMNSSLIKPIKSVVGILDKVSTGDFSIKIDQSKIRKDETGYLLLSVKKMLDNITDMVNSVKTSVIKIDEQSDALSAVSEEMSASSQQVSETVQVVAKGTGEQAADLLEVNNILNSFGRELEGIVQSIKDIECSSKEISSMANDSSTDMARLSESVENISGAFKKFSEKITVLGRNISNINDISNLINSIAGQTNLLALNASIEAARAGEAGRGFAVVADEIRKLAEQVRESSDNINKLIAGVSSEAESLIGTSNSMNNELIGQNTIIHTAVKSFERIINAVDGIVPKIECVNNSAVHISDEKDNILGKIDGVSSISQEISASSQQISASSEEMSASTQEVASSAQALNSMTKDMKEYIDRFKL